jgi:exodeoxyribonuclease V gamma subunit
MRTAVTLQMARRFGVCTNLRFGFLAQWVWEQGSRVLTTLAPGTPLPQRTADSAQAPWQPALLTWRVLAALADPAWVAAQPRLARYLAQADAVTRFDLAQRVAGLVDQLVTYRPDWLAAWTDGRRALPSPDPQDAADEAWQAALWRRLQAEISADARHAGTDPLAAHSLAAALAALPTLSDGDLAALRAGGLPAEAHLFCLPTIAPVHLALLQQLARWVDLHVYSLNPCAEFWFDVVDPRRLGPPGAGPAGRPGGRRGRRRGRR